MADPAPPEIPHEDLEHLLIKAGLAGPAQSISFSYVGRFSNDIWRLDLGADLSLIVKVPYRPPRPAETDDAEETFYRFAAGRTLLPVPRFLGQVGPALVFMHEDLAPFSFSDGTTPHHAAKAMLALASLHAEFWEERDLPFPRFGDTIRQEAIQANYHWVTHLQKIWWRT